MEKDEGKREREEGKITFSGSGEHLVDCTGPAAFVFLIELLPDPSATFAILYLLFFTSASSAILFSCNQKQIYFFV